MDTDDAFAELGLRPSASEAEVKAAWRRLVSQWHPDRNVSAAAVERMQRINRAFKAIRHSGFAPGTARADATDPATPEPGRASSARAGTSRQRQGRGTDGAEARDTRRPRRTISRKIKLTLEEAAAGSTRVIDGRITTGCRRCDGVGHRILGGHCSTCGGSGAVRQRSWFGWIATQTECEDCHGAGIARQRCVACNGSGSESIEYSLRFRIPVGARDGDQLHVDGATQKPAPAPVDLNIRIELIEHRLFRLEADGTVRCEVPVDGFKWIANRAVDVPTLAGPQALQLERGRLDYRLRGQGFPVERRGPAGDQLIRIELIFPTSLSADQQILLDQLVATTSGSNADERLQQWQQTWGGSRGDSHA
ncbi:DnaJ C-terminal domain-containing protein [Piscinibacter sakaiensis]|uniref:DnaJ C-terminal domain-containing protein n=1 Tax=Piscinibacter sakaiensis TaxID=1547922 RepID=UPI003AAF60DF